jgi:hypothetical protein
MSCVFPARDAKGVSQPFLEVLNPFNTSSIDQPVKAFYGLAYVSPEKIL